MNRVAGAWMVCAALSVAAGAESRQAPSNASQPPARGAAPAAASPQEIPLWENGAPGALGQADTDKPTLTIYRAPRGNSGTAIIVAPGGGYGALATEHEGRQGVPVGD